MEKRRSSKNKAPKEGWQNVSLWESQKGNSAYNGKLQLSLSFIEIILDRIESEEIEIIERDGLEYIQLGIAIRDNEGGRNNSPVYLGNVWIPEPVEEEDEEPRRRSKRSRYQDDDEEDEEPRSRRRRSTSKERRR